MVASLRYVVERPEVGSAFTDQGHEYVAAAVKPHVNRDGTASFVIRWIGTCAKCGAPFEFVTGPRVYDPRRRCEPCVAKRKRPGKVLRPFKGGLDLL